jgi:hypothetical protein
MKKAIIFLSMFLLFGITGIAQVGINADNSAPDQSAGLDVKFNNKGFLLPRMLFEQRNAIISPAEGLMVFCTDCGTNGAISVYSNGAWRTFTPCTTLAPTAGIHVALTTQITWNWLSSPGAAGYKWNTINNYSTATDMGLLISKTETGLACNTLFTRFIWAYYACGTSSPTTLTQTTASIPSIPIAGTHVPGTSQIIWNWNTTIGATGYKWNTTHNYATAIDMGTLTSKTEKYLDCNTPYTRFVWAYNVCGNSASSMMTQTTLGIPAPAAAGIHVPYLNQIEWNWNTVTGAAGYKWGTTNDYASAIDMGTATSKTETDLTPAYTYTRYIWAYNFCGISASTTLTQILPLSIGQSYQGGIIFFLDETGAHGLISATSDQSTNAEWGCSGTTIGGTSSAIGTGQANTTAIVNGCSTAGIAAHICNDLVLNYYSDWFLPSKDELDKLYHQQTFVGGFANDNYWSSSEYSANHAWAEWFGSGTQANSGKSLTHYVRAVRAF